MWHLLQHMVYLLLWELSGFLPHAPLGAPADVHVGNVGSVAALPCKDPSDAVCLKYSKINKFWRADNLFSEQMVPYR